VNLIERILFFVLKNLKLNFKIDDVKCYEIKDTDHFNVIEKLSEESYELTRVSFQV
jgi:hypothetical protein